MPRINRKLVLAFYAVMLLVAGGWALLRGTPNLFVNPEFTAPLTPALVLKSILIGGLAAGIVVVLTLLASHHFSWSRKLELHFAQVLGKMSVGDVFLVAFASGIAEEALFRGAIQPTLGWGVTTLLFGLMHIGPSRVFIPWTLSALLIGGVLGYFFDALGTLAAPVTCHVLVNLINLFVLRQRYPALMKFS